MATITVETANNQSVVMQPTPVLPDKCPPTAVLPGVWRFRFGVPEEITPLRTRHSVPTAEALGALPQVDSCPVTASGSASSRGFLVSLPLVPGELVYGLGLPL